MQTHKETNPDHFDEHHVLHELHHYLPAQAPLKDFVHHNTLHAFQSRPFHQAIRAASEYFGYNVSLTLEEYRSLFQQHRIDEHILDATIRSRKGENRFDLWKERLMYKQYDGYPSPRIGQYRSFWKKAYRLDMDSMVHPTLFRILCSYLDQGISMWTFPITERSFLLAIRRLESESSVSLFKSERARKLLFQPRLSIKQVLHELVGNEKLFADYIFDQQFAHQGWSGMVATIERQPESLLDRRKINLHDLIILECLFEIDALEQHQGKDWKPLNALIQEELTPLFAPTTYNELHEVLSIWQEAFEFSYYDQVFAGIQQKDAKPENQSSQCDFQAFFCIDDRECSIRRYIEEAAPGSRTFGTPGFFGVEFFYKPEHGKFTTKLCPAPVTPKFLIKEVGSSHRHENDIHFSKHTHNTYTGWLVSQTVGFTAAAKLFFSVFNPKGSTVASSSLRHMDKAAQLTVEFNPKHPTENGLQVGFKINEMIDRVESVLRSTGLISDFAPIVYMVGHGSSTINNPHYSAYDCGACCGRPGSVNARVFATMANLPDVRNGLRERGIDIPDSTQFIGALHDTTRDDIVFYDENTLNSVNMQSHKQHALAFQTALDMNAKERSRRFESIDTKEKAAVIHDHVRRRSDSLFEPRPELNHATNALCIVGRRPMSSGIFLDRRSFLNSYDYQIDPKGTHLLGILKAAAPVCGGINLEYFFSRVDNQKLGAGTKLPHNVMGLIGVANGTDGDLRPGLPSQMIEVHDPIRLMIMVEQYPEVTLNVLKTSPETYEWFENEWVHLACIDPNSKEVSLFKDGQFIPYTPLTKTVERVPNIEQLIESRQENFPVFILEH